jgi:hypothetical protein
VCDLPGVAGGTPQLGLCDTIRSELRGIRPPEDDQPCVEEALRHQGMTFRDIVHQGA